MIKLINPIKSLKELATTKPFQQESASINIDSAILCPVCGMSMRVCESIENQMVRTCLACAVSIPMVKGDS